MTKNYQLIVVSCLLLVLVACGGNSGEEPTVEAVTDPVGTSVRQTVDAIAVAQTVAALVTPGEQATPTIDDTVQPTTTALPSPTLTLPTAAPTATTVVPPPTSVPTAAPPTAVPATVAPTIAVPTATATRVSLPPSIENDAPGGSFPEDGSVFFNIIVDPVFLFRMDVRDLRFGDFEGAGIESVGFSISGNEVDYFREERTAGFCVFGGGEPTCNPWPTNEHGQYTWGVGGPVVLSGTYFVNMSVTAEQPDEEFGGFWNWNFDFQVTVP
jgi:hypothetical protein